MIRDLQNKLLKAWQGSVFPLTDHTYVEPVNTSSLHVQQGTVKTIITKNGVEKIIYVHREGGKKGQGKHNNVWGSISEIF